TAVLERRPTAPDVGLTNIREHKVTKLITVPTVIKNIIEFLTQKREKADLPALAFVASASEKMPPEMFERFYDLTGVELFDSIGSSEIIYEWIGNPPEGTQRRL